MLKSILKLEGAKELTINEKKNIKGSNVIPPLCGAEQCNPGDCDYSSHLPVCNKAKDLL
jgi:hypothetical protein